MAKIPDSLKTSAFAAIDVLRNYNILEPPVNISKILDWEWLMIWEFSFPNELENIAWMLDVDKKMIYINEDDEDFNKSITVAHELWHWILHKKILLRNPDKYSFVFKKRWSSIVYDSLENEANCFARNLIVPWFMLDTYKPHFSIKELAKIFGTSPFIIEKRIAHEYSE